MIRNGKASCAKYLQTFLSRDQHLHSNRCFVKTNPCCLGECHNFLADEDSTVSWGIRPSTKRPKTCSEGIVVYNRGNAPCNFLLTSVRCERHW